MKNFAGIDTQGYLEDLVVLSQLTTLYSDNDKPYLDSRVVEKLFCLRSGFTDLSRRDSSFDAKNQLGVGVGIKTFIARSQTNSKVEKVAEFTKLATKGMFSGLSGEALAIEVSKFRNSRISSDANESGIQIDKSFYHCVVRVEGGLYFLEQPYSTVNVNGLTPTDRFGKPAQNFSKAGHVYFYDGASSYMYNVAKNVLYKRFDPSESLNSNVIAVLPEMKMTDILEKLRKWVLPDADYRSREARDALVSDDFVVLPLYSTGLSREDRKVVAERSGLNNWNARGRKRAFGESYVPCPSDIHTLKPGFFPAKEQSFTIRLPNGEIISAKICQAGGKALMANPNDALFRWLYSIIDGSFDEAEKRLTTSNPYTYSDLEKIDKDSVKITRVHGKQWDYEMQTMPLGSYEDFLRSEFFLT